MRKLICIHGASEEAFQLIPLLTENPEVELGAIYDAGAGDLRARLTNLDPEVAAVLDAKLTDDADTVARNEQVTAVIDASPDEEFASRFPEAVARGLQVVTPLMARLLWGYSSTSTDRKGDLIQVLHEVLESYNLTIDTSELFQRMLEIALSVTGAEGGSVMLLDPEHQELRVRVAAAEP